MLLANVPYVPTDAIALMPPEARDHETRATLDGGADGLEVMRRVSVGGVAPGWLRAARCSSSRASGRPTRCAGCMRADGLEPRVVRSDDLGATVVTGTRTGQERGR